MANLESAVMKLAELVEHLIGTHVHWNMDLSKEEAVLKLGAVKSELLAHDAEKMAQDVEQGDLVALVDDAEKTLADAKAPVTPNE